MYTARASRYDTMAEVRVSRFHQQARFEYKAVGVFRSDGKREFDCG